MVGGNFDIPIMYQDLANYTMSPMSMPMMPFGGITGGSSTSYLGGTQIKPQLDQDKVEIMNKKDAEGKSTAKKVALALGAVFLIGFIPGLFGKKSLVSKIGGLFKSGKTSLSNFWTKIKGQPNKLGRFKAWSGQKWSDFKNWCGQKWTALKNLFHKKQPAAPTP